MIPGLERYFSILDGKATAKYLIAKSTPASPEKTLERMWEVHARIKANFQKMLEKNKVSDEIPDYSYLDLKIDILREMLKNCAFCERRCGINRYKTAGYCGCKVESYYSSEFLHLGEEPELIPSHTIFFNRCTFSCVYCQNYDIVLAHTGNPAIPDRLAEAIFRRSLQGSRNVNFVGGNPDQHAHTILMVMKASSVNLPMVWNSNMYHSRELAEIIEDVVDVFLADFRYGNNTCAKRLSNVNNYWEVVTRNFKSAYENSEMIIRHLILPRHLECCSEPILRWIADNLGQSVRFNLMFQYYPTYKAYEYPDISRRLTYEEKKRSIELVERYGLINVIR